MKKLILFIFALIFIVNLVNGYIRYADIPAIASNSNCTIVILNQSLTLTQDITNTCYLIDKDNITLNCNNYKIKGNNAGFGIATQEHYITWPCTINPTGLCGDFIDSKNINIKNCVIENFAIGISTHHINGTIENNLLKNNQAGASFNGNYLIIINNILKNNAGAGLTLRGKNFIVKDNTMQYNNGSGLRITQPIISEGRDEYNNPTCTKITPNHTLQNNTITNNKIGINLECLKEGSLSNYNLVGNREIGILAKVDDYTISQNNINGSLIGIKLQYSGNNITISQNQITGLGKELSNGNGINIFKASNIIIKENQIFNFKKGISSQDFTKMDLTNSEISNNEIITYLGIEIQGPAKDLSGNLHESTLNKVLNNNIKSQRGIILNGNTNQIKNNILTREGTLYHTDYGISVTGNSNLIDSNSILNKFAKGILVNGNSNTIKNNIIEQTQWDSIIVNGQNNIQENNQISEDSIIINNGNQTITFIPVVEVEYKPNGIWINKTNLTFEGVVSVLPGKEYRLTNSFNMYRPDLRKFNEPGQYRLHLILRKYEPNHISDILTKSDGTPLEAYHEFTVVQQNFLMRIINNIRNAFS